MWKFFLRKNASELSSAKGTVNKFTEHFNLKICKDSQWYLFNFAFRSDSNILKSNFSEKLLAELLDRKKEIERIEHF